MHVNVSDILRQGEGAQVEYDIDDETPELDELELSEPLSGQIRVIGTKSGVLVSGNLSAGVKLECHRCLRAFDHHLDFPVQAEFEDHPMEEQYPIDKRGHIDLAEPVRQELVVHLPIQQLCQADCEGIELNQKKDKDGSS